ncbi:transporter substrate-binding domain-containing protein [Cryobacterium sp. TMS1-20-1]|uniref:ABC transporter substrate-binding protein n=1 Tax=Cryobacterium sp. TMS1-20-1 TaxID=1259223 RepID=UPI00106A821A|nr:ABC transporter substrate-binding protein [Cryobacterium sp. TMS1-20-1]TFC72464.1 transporter substrate-binding domain-containing protein [Cryobacterium sp. TMS1-20-1]
MFHSTRTISGLAGLAIVAVALTGCSSTETPAADTTADSADGALTTVTVGVLAIAPSVAMQYGIDEGIFEKHGLDVQLQTGQGGAAMLPAVYAGSMDFAIGNPLSVMVAVDKGLQTQIVTGYSNSKADGDDINGVVVRTDSGIDGFADLENQTVSVNAVSTQGDLTIKESTEIDGGDSTLINFNEMPFPDREAQLAAGNTDAIWLPEPFLSKALASSDFKLIGYPNQQALPGLPTMVTFTSAKYAAANADTLTKFRDAVDETLASAEANLDDVRATLPAFMGMDAAVAENMKMETFDGEVPADVLADLGDLTQKYEIVTEAPDVGAMIAS